MNTSKTKSPGPPIHPDGALPIANPSPDEQSDATQANRDIPPAGPHARKDLTNPDATPGSGVLPEDRRDGEVDPGAG